MVSIRNYQYWPFSYQLELLYYAGYSIIFSTSFAWIISLCLFRKTEEINYAYYDIGHQFKFKSITVRVSFINSDLLNSYVSFITFIIIFFKYLNSYKFDDYFLISLAEHTAGTSCSRTYDLRIWNPNKI